MKELKHWQENSSAFVACLHISSRTKFTDQQQMKSMELHKQCPAITRLCGSIIARCKYQNTRSLKQSSCNSRKLAINLAALFAHALRVWSLLPQFNYLPWLLCDGPMQICSSPSQGELGIEGHHRAVMLPLDKNFQHFLLLQHFNSILKDISSAEQIWRPGTWSWHLPAQLEPDFQTCN